MHEHGRLRRLRREQPEQLPAGEALPLVRDAGLGLRAAAGQEHACRLPRGRHRLRPLAGAAVRTASAARAAATRSALVIGFISLLNTYSNTSNKSLFLSRRL